MTIFQSYEYVKNECEIQSGNVFLPYVRSTVINSYLFIGP